MTTILAAAASATVPADTPSPSAATTDVSDSGPRLFATMWSMRHLRSTNTIFLTAPVAKRPLASQDGTDYVILDKPADDELWAALRADRVGEYLALHTEAEQLR